MKNSHIQKESEMKKEEIEKKESEMKNKEIEKKESEMKNKEIEKKESGMKNKEIEKKESEIETKHEKVEQGEAAAEQAPTGGTSVPSTEVQMAGKGGKGLLAGKTTAANKDKEKKKPVSSSSRAGLQVEQGEAAAEQAPTGGTSVPSTEVQMAGKGGKGLLAGKTTAANKDKEKKRPVSRSSRAGLQVALEENHEAAVEIFDAFELPPELDIPDEPCNCDYPKNCNKCHSSITTSLSQYTRSQTLWTLFSRWNYDGRNEIKDLLEIGKMTVAEVLTGIKEMDNEAVKKIRLQIWLLHQR